MKINYLTYKKNLALFFLSLYLSTVFSVVFPYIEYIINYNYISEVLCINKDKPEKHCNGKCHLKKQLEKSYKTQIPDDKAANSPIVLTQNDFYPAIINNHKIEISSLSNILSDFNLYQNLFLIKDVYSNIFRPPQFV